MTHDRTIAIFNCQDNRAVPLPFSFLDIDIKYNVQRWSESQKKFIIID